ncbi:MAG: site-2 protease family protein [Candidatus Moranbacteria bacterium]|jgi:Zn-dependent protease|nr:site-2 protease family protein [Candidatus Moranbacteria bacterium]MDX9855271.1 site-2 protease family protein [Candidatus Moranbacteria bacterium]
MPIEAVLITFQVIILIMSVVIHEVSHGLSAFYLGDPTAKYAGRLTLNPIKHLDPWGSFIVPFLMIISFGFGFGWAKPVPYNPYNLKDQKKGPALVALAGPLSNIIAAIIFGLGARFIPLSFTVKSEIMRGIFDYQNLSILLSGSFSAIFFWLFVMILTINVFLAVFNLIPIPPLDGSKLLYAFIPISEQKKIALEQYGFIFLLLFIFLFSAPLGILLSAVLSIFFRYVVGV